MRSKITTLITHYDTKYKRAMHADLVFLCGIKSVEIVKQIRQQIAKRNRGVYELVGVLCPKYEELGLPELNDDQIDDAYEEFDKIVAELLATDSRVAWIVPVGHEKYEEESSALHFTDLGRA